MESFPTIKVFINWLDTYTGYNLSLYLFNYGNAGVSFGTVTELETEPIVDESTKKSVNYEIYGTVKSQDTNNLNLTHVRKIISRFNQMELVEWVSNCSVLIYDITDDPEQISEAKWALHVLEDDLSNEKEPKTFILISTVLTWLQTPLKQDIKTPEEEEEVEVVTAVTGPLPFTEDDYRRRKPHPNYKKHWLFEKDVIRIGRFKPEVLKTYVISAGVKYGKGEDILFYFFKSAWLNAQFLPCIGHGKNTIPFIYITDLAALVQSLMDRVGPSSLYILAVDGALTKFDAIVKAISEKLTTGVMKRVSLENALLISELKSRHLDHLTCDLMMESSFMSSLSFEGGILPHISDIIDEFKSAHGLEPIRVFIHGPPGSGQKEVVDDIVAYYKLHPIFIKTLIHEKIMQLKKISASVSDLLRDSELGDEEEAGEENDIEIESSEEGESDEDEAEISQRTLQAQEYLRSIRESQERNNGELEEKFIWQILQEKLLSKPCQNQGFVLYGYPETIDQAKDLFIIMSENEETYSNNALTMPELVVNLDAPDSFLKEKLIQLPEIELIQQYGSEEELMKKLSTFRNQNTDDDTILNFFDEQEVRTEMIDISTIESMKSVTERVKRLLGPPRNFGLSPEETEKQLRIKAEQTLKYQMEAKLRAETAERLESAERAELLRDWQKKLAEVRLQEEQMLEAESLPMRNYLMQHVLPVLSQGLLECVKIRPEDPINFLAEYLFKFTPVEFPTPGVSKKLS